MAEKRKRGRPATGQTPTRGIRVPDEVWDAAKQKAAEEGTDVSSVVNDCLKSFLKRGRKK